MEALVVKVQLMRDEYPDVELPERATNGSAGFDLKAVENKSIPVGGRALVHTGVKVAIEPGYQAEIRPRSGLALKRGITVLNTPGTIDSDYRGEVGVILANLGTVPVDINRGDRIAQMVFMPAPSVFIHIVDSVDETERGAGGFGSTGE